MDLSTMYLGLRLKSPLVLGACELAMSVETVRKLEAAGAGMVVMHSLFEEQFTAEQIALRWGMEHGSGPDPESAEALPGADEFKMHPEEYYAQIAKLKKEVQIPIVGSINGVTAGNWVMYARRMAEAGADAIELNVYDPTMDVAVSGAQVEQRVLEIFKLVKGAVKVPVAVKLSPFYSSFANLALQLDNAGADGLVIFNRFYQPDINVNTMDVFRTLKLSTPDELLLRLRWAAALADKIKAGIAITGGVHSGEDVAKCMLVGAQVVQMTSSILEKGVGHVAVVKQQLESWMRGRKIETLGAVRGKLSLANSPNRSAVERVNYVNLLVGKEEPAAG
jgi:dihydroorotate dehydrogenase (fumarate)